MMTGKIAHAAVAVLAVLVLTGSANAQVRLDSPDNDVAVTTAAPVKPAVETPETPAAVVANKFNQPNMWLAGPEGDRVVDILNTLSREEEVDFVWLADQELDRGLLTRRVCTPSEQMPLTDLLTQALASAGLQPEFDGEILTVSAGPSVDDYTAPTSCYGAESVITESSAPAQPAAQAPAAPAVSSPTPHTAPVPAVPAPAVPAPSAYPPYPANRIRTGGPTPQGQAARMAYLQRFNTAGYGYGARPLSYTPLTFSWAGGYGSGYGGYRSYGRTGGYYIPQFCAYYPADRNCTHGSLRVDAAGSERTLQGIDLYVNGSNMGPVSKYNRWPNKGARVPVGPAHIQFVQIPRDTGDPILVYETRMTIEPDYVMRGEPNLIRLDSQRMFNAPYRDGIEHRQTEIRPAEAVLPNPRTGQ